MFLKMFLEFETFFGRPKTFNLQVMRGVLIYVRMVFMDGENKLSLVDFVKSITDKNTKQANVMIKNALTSAQNGEKANRLLHTTHKFTGQGGKEAWVVTIKEATSYLQCLPHKYTLGVLDYIEDQFFRVTVGDPSLHEEIDRNAKRKHVFACAMRESLDVDNRPLKVLKT